MAARSAPFFSLQPEQEDFSSGLSKLRSYGGGYGPNLPHVPLEQDYLNPGNTKPDTTLGTPFNPGTAAAAGSLAAPTAPVSGAGAPDINTLVGTAGGARSTVTGTQFQPGQDVSNYLMSRATAPTNLNISPTGTVTPDSQQAVQQLSAYNPTTGVTALAQKLGDTSAPPPATKPQSKSDLGTLSDFNIGETGVEKGAPLAPAAERGGTAPELAALGATGPELMAPPQLPTTTGTQTQGAPTPGIADINALTNIAQAAAAGDPSQITAAALKAAPLAARYILDNQDAIAKTGNVTQALAGAFYLQNGLRNNDPGQIIGGMGALLTGSGRAIGTTALANVFGVAPETIGAVLGVAGGAGSLYGFYAAVDKGDTMGAMTNALSIYASLAPVVNEVAGTALPTIGSLVSSLVTTVAPDAAAALGIGVSTAATEAAVAGAGGAAEAAGVAGGAAVGSGLALGVAAVVAYPAIVAIMNGISQMFGAGFSEQEQNKLKNNFKEISGIQKDIQTAWPVVTSAADLPQRAAPLLASNDPAQIMGALTQAAYIIDQGPVISRAMSTPKAGPFKLGFTLPDVNGLYGNAINTYMQSILKLDQLGAIQVVPGQPNATQFTDAEGNYYAGGAFVSPPTYTAGGQQIPYIVSPEQIQSFAQADPQLAQQYTEFYSRISSPNYTPGVMPPQAPTPTLSQFAPQAVPTPQALPAATPAPVTPEVSTEAAITPRPLFNLSTATETNNLSNYFQPNLAY